MVLYLRSYRLSYNPTTLILPACGEVHEVKILAHEELDRSLEFSEFPAPPPGRPDFLIKDLSFVYVAGFPSICQVPPPPDPELTRFYPYSAVQPFLKIVDFIEASTNTALEDLVICKAADPRVNSLPFACMLEAVQDMCGHNVEELIILHSEEFHTHKNNLVKLIAEKYTRAFSTHCEKQIREEYADPRLLGRIFELERELKDRERDLRNREEHIAQLDANLETKSHARRSGKRRSEELRSAVQDRKASRRSSRLVGGLDGADDRSSSIFNDMMLHSDSQGNIGYDGARDSEGDYAADAQSQDNQRHTLTSSLGRFRSSRVTSPGSGLTTNASATSSSRSSTAGVSLTMSESRRSSSSMAPPFRPRTIAPGLAMPKKKIDPYDPIDILKPVDKFTLLEETHDPEVRGTWTTIDPEDNKRNFDRRWHASKKEKSTERSNTNSLTPFTDRGRRTDNIERDGVGSTPIDDSQHDTHTVDSGLEDPALDVDPAVRTWFRPISQVLDERVAPQSAFEQRNQGILPKKAGTNVMKVVIGGQVAKDLRQEPDSRGQFQDRHGNYVGEDLGRMKKHLQEDRAALIKLRDEEMVRATREKRAFEAMSPGEKERKAPKRRASSAVSTSVPGAADSDIFSYTDVPEVYNKRITTASIASWASRSTTQGGSVIDSDIARMDDDAEIFNLSSNRDFEPFSPTPRNTGSSVSEGRSSTTIAPSSYLPTTDRPTLTLIPDTAPLPVKPEPDDTKAEQFDLAQALCQTHPRIVAVTLRAPVHFSPDAVISRVFGGMLQDIQIHAHDRLALVTFIFPGEAATFVTHCAIVKQMDAQADRALQIDVEWYGGSEESATLAMQKSTHMRVIEEAASRVLQVSGIPAVKKREQLADEMKRALDVSLVKVALVQTKKNYVRKAEGNTAIIEFLSIKAAVDAMAAFKAGKIAGYANKNVVFLRDSCDRPPVQSSYCGCASCAG
ncbi:MAG: hypothetical protein M1833_000182 [Piccolia ochrophora]|nr:MAG: hypothetical protein M1833_000182 [Piccolia ochrophora]